MSLLSNILDTVLKNLPQAPAAAPDSTAPAPTEAAPSESSSVTKAATAAAGAAAGAAGAALAKVDISSVLDALVKKSGESLDWKHSVVDLLKAIGHDSSHAARVKLAEELHYDGDVEDSARMNEFLRNALLKALQEHGGTLPDDLK
jgi:hypothetical protein